MKPLSDIRIGAVAMLAAFSLALTGCFITPGKFQSNLDLRNDGSFTFNYDGEIFFIGLSNLARMGGQAQEFTPEDCRDEETYEERECSEDELAEQRAAWEELAQQRAEKAEKDAQEMAAIMGGIDPTDPEAMEELRQLLSRHKGWNKVEAKGNGVFDVEFSTSGQLSHDMMFPIIEGFPSVNMFVQVILRDDNQVRVNAPGFAAQGDTNSLGAMMGGMAGMAGLSAIASNSEDAPEVPAIDGTFTITTDGAILANNTDEGPSSQGGASVLSWDVDSATSAAPTALIKLGN